MKSTINCSRTRQRKPFDPHYWPVAGLMVLVAVATSGCGNAKARMESSAHLKGLSTAAVAYHEENKAYPDKLDQIKPFIGKTFQGMVIGEGKDFAELMKNPDTGDDPGYEYVKPEEFKAGAPNPVMIYQLRGGKRDETMPAAYRDAMVKVPGGRP